MLAAGKPTGHRILYTTLLSPLPLLPPFVFATARYPNIEPVKYTINVKAPSLKVTICAVRYDPKLWELWGRFGDGSGSSVGVGECGLCWAKVWHVG